MIINPIGNKPFTTEDADRLLGKVEEFFDEHVLVDRTEYDAIRPLLAMAPALYQQLAALTTMAENFWGKRDYTVVVEARKLVEDVRIDRQPMETPRPEALAIEFADLLKQCLRPSEWVEMRRNNAKSDFDNGCCASHDYCDANMVMLRAFVSLAGREIVMDESDEAEADRRVWNKAWDIAKDKYLTEKGTT